MMKTIVTDKHCPLELAAAPYATLREPPRLGAPLTITAVSRGIEIAVPAFTIVNGGDPDDLWHVACP